jgi:protein-S-isoprenylcysteine O-methyltransferase Ste14
MGKRGEGWVALQVVLFLFIISAPLVERFALPSLRLADAPSWLRALGVLLMAAGGLFGMAGVLGLGRNLTAFPRPLEGGELVTSGVYGVVRHPIYAGLILAAFGWALWNAGLLTLALAVLLFAFFDLKSRREEHWLVEAYPDYPAYQRRVKKLIPWVY